MNTLLLTENQVIRLLEYGTVNVGDYLIINIDKEGE